MTKTWREAVNRWRTPAASSGTCSASRCWRTAHLRTRARVREGRNRSVRADPAEMCTFASNPNVGKTIS
jgi:hypothetical protein